MLTSAMVQSVQDLIGSRKTWTTYALARDRSGEEVSPRSKEACAWCTVGAIKRELDLTDEVDLHQQLDRAAEDLFPGAPTIIHINDRKGHDAVMACFDRVKERLT